MPREWEAGSAARQPSFDDTASNPFAPIDVAARLQNPSRRTSTPSASAQYAPGQLYGSAYMSPSGPLEKPSQPPLFSEGQPPLYQPDMSFAPSASFPAAPGPMAAPQMEPPSYLQPAGPLQGPSLDAAQWYAADVPPDPYGQPAPFQKDGQVGALYSASMFAHQPTAVMPSLGSDTPFANRTTDEISHFFDDPVRAGYTAWPTSMPEEEDGISFQDEPQAEEPAPHVQEPVWRDPFTPAEKPDKPQSAPRQKKPPRAPVRMGRVLAVTAAAAMLLFCGAVGGRMIVSLVHNEKSMETARSEYLEQTGQELHNGAARVDLLPNGQTFAPTSTPSPTPYVSRPTPTPVVPINEAAVLSLSGHAAVAGDAPVLTATPSLRNRLTSYPKNPLRNVEESIAAMVEENEDVIGRLVIEGVLDEMVMQRNNTYYLNRNSLGAMSEAGAVFADESCTLRFPPENLLLRGQTSVPGKTFAPLKQFASDAAFAAGHAVARLTTLYETESYVLFAVVQADSDPASSGYFNYASNPTFATDEAMMQYVQSARARSLYAFNVDVQPADRLLTLSTLGGDSTVVLIYRMAREGEYY